MEPLVTRRLCSFTSLNGEPCGRPHKGHGLCCGHLAQQKSGRELRPIGDYRRGRQPLDHRDGHGNKECVRCDAWLPESSFGLRKQSSDGLTGFCSRCQADRNHGVTPEMRERLLRHQDGKCVCGYIFDVWGGQQATYHIDHGHECCSGKKSCGECVRRLLCWRCNQGCGLLRESPEIMIRHAYELIFGRSSQGLSTHDLIRDVGLMYEEISKVGV